MSRVYEKAIDLEPKMALAYARAAQVALIARATGWDDVYQKYKRQVPEWVATARELAPENAEVEVTLGVVAISNGDEVKFALHLERVFWLDPNDILGLTWAGWGELYKGNLDEAETLFWKAARLGPFDRMRVYMEGGLALVLSMAGRYDEAIAHARVASEMCDSWQAPFRAKAAALAHLGRTEEAAREMQTLRRLDPEGTIKKFRDRGFWRDSAGARHFFDGMRKAGMPEE